MQLSREQVKVQNVCKTSQKKFKETTRGVRIGVGWGGAVGNVAWCGVVGNAGWDAGQWGCWELGWCGVAGGCGGVETGGWDGAGDGYKGWSGVVGIGVGFYSFINFLFMKTTRNCQNIGSPCSLAILFRPVH
jgi:hypothetical protein